MFPNEEHQDECEVCIERRLYSDLVKDLLPLDSLFEDDTANLQAYPTIDYTGLIHADVSFTPGRDESKVVRIPSDPNSLYVYKGISLASVLIDGDVIEERKAMCYNEFRTVLAMPGHSNVKQPAGFSVTTTRYDEKRESVVCGTLYPFMKNTSLDRAINKQRKPPKKKKKKKLVIALAS